MPTRALPRLSGAQSYRALCHIFHNSRRLDFKLSEPVATSNNSGYDYVPAHQIIALDSAVRRDLQSVTSTERIGKYPRLIEDGKTCPGIARCTAQEFGLKRLIRDRCEDERYARCFIAGGGIGVRK